VGGARRFICLAGAVALIAATTPISSVAAAGADDQAKALLSDRCAICHGVNGDGHGVASASLVPPPKDFHNREWQKSVTDKTLATAIVQGGPAVGLSPAMPGNPDLVNSPDVVAAMVKQIRAWGK
jgi:mono/diheme cytochrome c family protein